MVFIYTRTSPNEASQPPKPGNTHRSYPCGRGRIPQQSSPVIQKRGGKYQPPRHTPAALNFEGQPLPPPPGFYQYPPVPQGQSQPAPETLEPPQYLPEADQQMFAGYPPQFQQQFDPGMSQQNPAMTHQYPPMNFQQPPPNFEMQQVVPSMEYMPPGAFGGPPQFVPPPMYSPENLVPFNGTVPPPNFEQVYNSEYLDPRFTPSPLPNGFMQMQENLYAGIPMQPFPLYIPAQKLPNQRRPNAIAIIDPVTGVDKLTEIYGGDKPDDKIEKEGKPTID